MRLGVLILPEDRWPLAAKKWRRAEVLGFDHAWTYDHLAWGPLHGGPWFGAVPTLTAAASVTETIRLGTLVASPNFRHPVPFAREVLTVDDISGGRLVLGLGSGGLGWDPTVLGQEPWSLAERTGRFVEFVDLLDRLLRQPVTSFSGRYWQARDARSAPGCVQQPRVPFAIAATGARTTALAARHAAIWVTNGDRAHTGPPLGPDAGSELFRSQLARFEDACAAEGRDPNSVDRLVLTGPRLDAGLHSAAAFAEVREAYRKAGATDLVVHWPRPSEPYAGEPTMLERVRG